MMSKSEREAMRVRAESAQRVFDPQTNRGAEINRAVLCGSNMASDVLACLEKIEELQAMLDAISGPRMNVAIGRVADLIVSADDVEQLTLGQIREAIQGAIFP